jgi:hypothetical protein
LISPLLPLQHWNAPTKIHTSLQDLSFRKPKLHGFYDVRNRQQQVYCFRLDKKLNMNLIHVELKWVSKFGTPFGPLCFFSSDAIFFIMSHKPGKHGLLAPLWLDK